MLHPFLSYLPKRVTRFHCLSNDSLSRFSICLFEFVIVTTFLSRSLDFHSKFIPFSLFVFMFSRSLVVSICRDTLGFWQKPFHDWSPSLLSVLKRFINLFTFHKEKCADLFLTDSSVMTFRQQICFCCIAFMIWLSEKFAIMLKFDDIQF